MLAKSLTIRYGNSKLLKNPAISENVDIDLDKKMGYAYDQSSRMIGRPLRVFDFIIRNDGICLTGLEDVYCDKSKIYYQEWWIVFPSPDSIIGTHE